MRLRSLRIEQFRCLRELDLDLDAVTVLVGANGSGKSSVLHAVDWLFRGGPLEIADIHGRSEDWTVMVQAAFTDLSAADRTALGRLAGRDALTVRRVWSAADGEEVTVTTLAYPLFAPLRGLTTATPFRQAYEQLQREHSGLELPPYRNLEGGRQALFDWEAAHPDQLEPMPVAAPNLFSRSSAGAGLAGRFDYVLVPAVTDADEQTRDARGTLLRRLLERVVVRQPVLDKGLDEVAADANERMGKLLAEGHADALNSLERQLTDALRRYVDGTSVSLKIQRPNMRPPVPEVALRVDDGSGPIDPSRQGHGVQRTLMMTLVQQLAEPPVPTTPDDSDPPALLLAIEEPELYQHPLQARHLARVLASLPERGSGTMQVAYATHSAHFVDTHRYERLRRFSKTPGSMGIPSTMVRAATVEAVVERLRDAVPPEEMPWRIEETLRRRLAEAVFAHAVLLVEGPTDAAVYRAVADQNPATSLDATGVAVVLAGGKTLLPLLWAILIELGIPVYVVFDGDAGMEGRMRAASKLGHEIETAVTRAKEKNRLLLRLLGEPESDWPITRVTARYATLHDRLEEELAETWPAMLQVAGEFAAAQCRNVKNEECYYQAALQSPDPPQFTQDIIDAVSAMAREARSLGAVDPSPDTLGLRQTA